MNENLKRIVKNSVFLYIRFLFILFVGLYTSRVVLANLGVIDFGIYNVIAGIITIFSLLRLTFASQRFISYELGRRNNRRVFAIIRNFNTINLVVCIFTFIIAETIGLFFFYDYLNIPNDRLYAAFIVYQCTIISFLSLVYSTTYNSAIVSYEYMSAFAYISIVEGIGKLIIAFLLKLDYTSDKLILYSVLMMAFQILINISFIVYCKYRIKGIPLTLGFDKLILKEVIGFSLWLNFSGIFIWLSNQGLNILLNIFVGPIANAARGISVQIQGAASGFCINIMQAVAPQIVKNYASSNWDFLQTLFILSSKYSFLLMTFIGLPVFFSADYILRLWLGDNIPIYATMFVKLTMIWLTISMLSQPCMYTVQASGDLRTYQIVDFVFCGLIFLFSYIALKQGFPCVFIYYISITFEVIMLFIRIIIVSPKIKMKLSTYFKRVVIRLIPISAVVVVFNIYWNMFTEKSIPQILSCYSLTAILLIVSLYLFGMEKNEKMLFYNYVRKKWKK